MHAALAIEHARVHTFVADSERLFRAMFDRSPIAIALLTEDQRITRVNVAFEKLLGRAAAELLGTVGGRAFPARSRPRQAGGRRRRVFSTTRMRFTSRDRTAAKYGAGSPPPILAARAGRNRVWSSPRLRTSPILRTIQARLAYAATHDRLTGLANRALVLDQLAAVLTEREPGPDRVAAFYCDLDHFKEINDSLGHAAGDQLLAEVARRLELTAREQDTVGRLGGDEFVVIAYPVPSAAERPASRPGSWGPCSSPWSSTA